MRKKNRIVKGGTWAGKTFGITALELIQYSLLEKTDTRVIAETIHAVKGGYMKDFENILIDVQRFSEYDFNRSDRLYKFPNGSKIKFDAYDSVGKAQAAGKFDVTIFSEANNINHSIADACAIRTTKRIWYDFNPVSEFYVTKEIAKKENAQMITLTYRDNEECPNSMIDEFNYRRELAKDSAYWKNWCDVYLDGKVGSVEGLIYREINLIKEFPKIDFAIGIDFGFSNSKTAIVKVAITSDSVYVDEICYRVGMSNDDIANILKQEKFQDIKIVCDSAEPKSIEYLRACGFSRLRGAGRKDVKAGIDFIASKKIYVTERSENIIKEFRGYMWKNDPVEVGKFINEPVKVNDHAMDALRMVGESEMKSIMSPPEYSATKINLISL